MDKKTTLQVIDIFVDVAVFTPKEAKLAVVSFLSRDGSEVDEVPISPAVWYNLGQTGIYGVMALGIMRLKLFFTPHLCIITALLAKDKVKV